MLDSAFSRFQDSRQGQMRAHAALMLSARVSERRVVGYLGAQHAALTSAVARPRRHGPAVLVARRVPYDGD